MWTTKYNNNINYTLCYARALLQILSSTCVCVCVCPLHVISYPANPLSSVPAASRVFGTFPRSPPRFRTANTTTKKKMKISNPKPSPKPPRTLSALRFSSPTLSNLLSRPLDLSRFASAASRRSFSSPVSRQSLNFSICPSDVRLWRATFALYRACPRVLVYIFPRRHKEWSFEWFEEEDDTDDDDDV